MKFRLITVSKMKRPEAQSWARDYERRLGHLASLQRVVVPEIPVRKGTTLETSLARQAELLLPELTGIPLVIGLDASGKNLDSEQWAAQFRNWENQGLKEIGFVIGGAFGLPDTVRKSCHQLWSLGKITLTHELAQVTLLEQIYRTFTILRGHPFAH